MTNKLYILLFHLTSSKNETLMYCFKKSTDNFSRRSVRDVTNCSKRTMDFDHGFKEQKSIQLDAVFYCY